MGPWHLLFMIASYSAILVCLYAVYRIGVERGWQWGAIHLIILGAFYVLFWLMESWAAIRTPYYVYPPAFPDVVGYYPWNTNPVVNLCAFNTPTDDGIPRAVLFLETALVFAAMHTAMLLTPIRRFRLLRPFMAALALLGLDLFLDPLASWSFECMTIGSPSQLGLGFWHWHVLPALGPDGFGIPLFNYAVWYAAPVVLIALVGLVSWFYDLAFPPIHTSQSGQMVLVIVIDMVFLAIIIFGFGIIIAFSPNFNDIPIYWLRLIFAAILVATLIAIVVFWKSYKFDNDFRWWFVYPQVVFLVFGVIALIGSGAIASVPYLWVVALVVTLLFLLWSISPYIKRIWP